MSHAGFPNQHIGSSYRWDTINDIWSPLTDFIGEDVTNYFGTESIALDPTDDQKLYLMQGEYHTVNQSAIFVSSDRGNTFSIHPTPFTSGSNDLGRNNGERLAVNPFKPSELYFGSRSAGLWKSEDRARTWTNVTNFPNAVTNGIGFSFVIFDPQQKGHIYVGANVPEGLWVSKDSGVCIVSYLLKMVLSTQHRLPGLPYLDSQQTGMRQPCMLDTRHRVLPLNPCVLSCPPPRSSSSHTAMQLVHTA